MGGVYIWRVYPTSTLLEDYKMANYIIGLALIKPGYIHKELTKTQSHAKRT